MFKEVVVEQQSDEWHKLRNEKIGASEAPIIMGVNPWCTPRKLWRRKLGLEPSQFKTDAMQRGLDLEPQVRLLVNNSLYLNLRPLVAVSLDPSFMMASLDGWDSVKREALEIKCPGPRDHEIAMNGNIPDKYMPQLQHQIYVLSLDKILYISYVDDHNYRIITVYRDDKYIKELIEKETIFFECLINLTEPLLIQKDAGYDYRKSLSLR